MVKFIFKHLSMKSKQKSTWFNIHIHISVYIKIYMIFIDGLNIKT